MIKVNVENFQSIESAEIEIEGLTVVTGKNNSGKSALLRAVNSVFTNALGSSFVRNGEDYCQVEIGFGDGNSIRWRKGEKVKPTYWINGGSPINSGRNAPQELEQFGVAPIKVGGREIWPQIAPQFTGQVFLIDLPGSVMAEVVADVDRVSELNQALKNCEKDKRSNNSLLKIRNKDLSTLQSQRENYDDLQDRIDEYSSLDFQRQHLEDLYARITKLEELRDSVKVHLQDVTTLSSITTHLKSLKALSKLENTISDTEKTLLSYNKISLSHRRYTKHMSHLCDVDELSVVGVDGIRDLRGRLKPLRSLLKRKQQSDEIISTFDQLSQIEIPNSKVPTEDDRLAELKSLRKNHLKSKNSVYTYEEEISQKEIEMREIARQMSQTLSEHEECPLCGGET